MKKCSALLKRSMAVLLCLCMLMSLNVMAIGAVQVDTSSVAATVNNLVFDAQSEVFTLYSGGSPSTVMEYDCGNAVANDGSKSYLRIIQNTTESEYLSYIQTLKNKGYDAVMYNKTVAADSGYNRFSSFVSSEGTYKVYTYYFPFYKETRIIVDTQSDTVEGFEYTSETGQSVEPLICMYGLSMSENGYDNSTTTEYATGKRNCGALFVIRMADNSLFIHDGGDIEQWDDQACDDFLQFCRNLTGVPEGEKMVINTWHISHAHTDHYLGLPRFFSRHHSQFDLKNIMYNIDIERTYTTRDMYKVVRMVASYYPDVRYYKPHTGESFSIEGVGFDVIYAVEDRYLPNENGEIITDYPTIENGKPVSAYDLGGTYREFCYEADGKSDFNDTSSVLKVTFTKGSEKVDSILYADMNLSQQILWDIYPDSYLENDIMMIPHHGFDVHTELCAMSKADIFLFTQHRGAIYGADGDLSTKDGAGLYRPALYKNYLEMQSAIETEGSKTYWQGNETAIISPFGVEVDIPETTKDTEAPSGYAVYLMDVRAFVYEGWSSDGSDNIVSGSDYTTDVNAVETVTNNFVYKRVDYPGYNGRYVIVHNQSDNIMHYTSTKPLEQATSIEYKQDGNALDVFHYALNSDGSVNKDYLYFDHSNRDGALWILKQTKKAAYGNNEIADNAELSYTNNDNLVTIYLGADKRYHHVNMYKGIGPVFNEDGTISAVKNGAYWYSVEGADAENTQERYINFNETQADMYSIDNTATQYEHFSDGTFVIYRKDGDVFHVLCCDEQTGTWYSKAYTADEAQADIESLKVRLYKYGSDEGVKAITLQGAQTFNVVEGVAGINVLERIPNELIVSDAANNLIHIPCSGTEKKIGYYWLKFESTFNSSTSRNTDDYKVGVYYHNDNATDTKVGEVTVHVQSDILIPDTAQITQTRGAVLKGSSADAVVRNGVSASSEICSFTVQVNTINGHVTRTIPVTLDMLTDSQGKAVDASAKGTFEKLTLTYEGQVITNNFTLKVYEQYTVTFKNYDGTVLFTQTVTEGESATAPENPSREADVNYIYTFKAWDKNFANITEDTVVTATYTETPQVYYLRGDMNDWQATDEMTKNQDGTYTFVKTLPAGTYEYKAANEDYSMEWPYGSNKFLTLEKESVVTFTLDTAKNTIEATFVTVQKSYTVIFKNWDGTVLSTQTVYEGEAAKAPENPSREADVDYVYTFKAWDKAFTNITEDTEVTATYTETPQVYYLRGDMNDWQAVDVMTKNQDGTYTFVTTLPAGTYEYKAANENYSMEWPLGSNKTLVLEKESIVTFTLDTKNHTIIASGEEVIREYSVIFKNWDGTILSNQTVVEGEDAKAPENPTKTPNVNYKYTFAGWDKDFTNITEDTVITATYTEIPQTYYLRGSFNNWQAVDVMTKNQDGTYTFVTTLPAGTYEYKAANEDYSMEWPLGANKTITLEKESVVTFTLNTENNTIEHEFEIVLKYFTVVFKDWDGTVLSTQTVLEDNSAVAPDAPSRASNAQYTYTFTGWDKSYDKITADTEIIATYAQTVNKYTVTFVDYDGKLISAQSVDYGAPATEPEAPQRQSDAQCSYTFKGWDKDFSSITGNLIVTAQYNVTYNKYTVTFMGYDGAVLDTQSVVYGTSAVAPEDPERPENAEYVYTFAGWDKEFNYITQDTIVTATYTQKLQVYYVLGSFNEWQATDAMTRRNNGVYSVVLALEAGEYEYMASNIAETMQWPADSYNTLTLEKDSVVTFVLDTNANTLTATTEVIAKEYVVTFVNFDGSVIDTQTVAEGESAVAPEDPERSADAQYTYIFAYWEGDYENVEADTTVTAKYVKITNKYIVSFVDDQGKLLETQSVSYGKSASAPKTPVKEADAQYTYTFTGWDKSFSEITADTVITAQFAKTVNKYSVTFLDKDGNKLDAQTVEYGKSATAPTAPVVNGYTFTGWDKAFDYITGDTTVKAQYEKTAVAVNKYIVTFVDSDGKLLSTQLVEEGKSATAPEAPAKAGYTFTGWDTAYDNITGDTVVKAEYKKNASTGEASTIGTLKVEIAGGNGFTIAINGGSARPQGTSYTSSKTPIGATVTLTANTVDGVDFMGWYNPMNGELLTADYAYTFITSGNDFYKAMYKTTVAGVNVVIFKNDKAFNNMGQIIEMQYYAAGDDIVFPENPTQTGWDFKAWNMTEEQIQAELKAGNDVEVLATWTVQKVYITVDVIGGTAEGSTNAEGKYLANNMVTLTADAAPAGQKFAYWTVNGVIRSYETEYSFYPSASCKAEAVFVAADAAVEYEVLVNLDTIDTVSVEGKNVFYYSWYVPEEALGVTFVKAGVIAVNKDNYKEENMYAGVAVTGYYDRSNTTGATGTYTWTKSSVTSGQTWVARAYVQYKLANGEIVTVYSDIVEATKD